MNIVIIGHVCIDKNVSEHSSYVAAGSPAMFMQKIYRQFPDCNVTVVASYGEDFLPYTQGTSLYPPRPNCTETLIYENITKPTGRVQKAHNRHCATPVAIDVELSRIVQDADLIFFAPLLPNLSPAYVAQIVQLKKEIAQIALLPQGYYRNFNEEDVVTVREFTEASEVLPLVDVVIVSEFDHPNMLREATSWSQTYNVISVVTLGEKGAVALQSGNSIQLPTKAVAEEEIVDSVGSGDIFSAGFAYQYQKTHSIEEAGQFANELARQCLFFTSEEIKIQPELLF